MNLRAAPSELALLSPAAPAPESFTDPAEAVAALNHLYATATGFLRSRFAEVMKTGQLQGRYRAFYPEISLTTDTFAKVDSRLAYGHVTAPGTYTTTVTRPDLFRNYLTQQLRLLIENHGVPVTIRASTTPIPLHFALPEGAHVEGSIEERIKRPLRDVFDVPDLTHTDDRIVNGYVKPIADAPMPLAPFTAQRIDYSLARLAHYTATSPEHFQNFTLFTNYQFYMDEFVAFARRAVADPASGYDALVEPGNVVTTREGTTGTPVARLPQMPTFHLKGPRDGGITMVNIGVGPSNAKTITDHIAVLRPHAWLMVGHCAGLRHSQSLGDYVLAHAYVREDHVLDDDLPVWVPIPALAEVQVAL
ncbi:MAG TPA: AMP nucleosidase, partial [Paracoccaceae bacterium]|nr:AMP nucleosidase [Paracoccaceae bacterium]